MQTKDHSSELRQPGITQRAPFLLSESEILGPQLLESEVTVIERLSTTDASQLLEAVQGSRTSLEPWLPWVPHCCDIEGAESYTLTSQADWRSRRAFRFSIRRKGSTQLIGALSIENVSIYHRNADLGYWLRRAAWGQGYALDACYLSLKFAFETLRLKRLRCAAATENTRSLKVIESLGFQFEGIARQAEFVGGRYVDHRIYSLLDSEYLTSRQTPQLSLPTNSPGQSSA